jgi:hypothetical protein
MARALASAEAKALHADGALLIGRINTFTAVVGGCRAAGLLSGVAFAAIVVGGWWGPTVLVSCSSARIPTRYRGRCSPPLATLVTAATVVAGPALDRERGPS